MGLRGEHLATQLDRILPEQGTSKQQIKYKILEKLLEIRNFFSYTVEDKAFVQLQKSRKQVLNALNDHKNVKKSFELVKKAEKQFQNQEYRKSIQTSQKALRTLKTSHKNILDQQYLGRKIRQYYQKIPGKELDRKYLILQTIKLVQENNEEQVFTFQQVRSTLKNSFPGQDPGFLQEEMVEVIQNHENVSKKVDLGSLSLYTLETSDMV